MVCPKLSSTYEQHSNGNSMEFYKIKQTCAVEIYTSYFPLRLPVNNMATQRQIWRGLSFSLNKFYRISTEFQTKYSYRRRGKFFLIVCYINECGTLRINRREDNDQIPFTLLTTIRPMFTWQAFMILFYLWSKLPSSSK